jgi:hypothetical protein
LENIEHAKVNIYHNQPNTGKQKGPRLDRWIKAKCATKEILYQVEIKNWSAHALGGQALKLNASLEEIQKVNSKYWSSIWDKKNKKFKYNEVGKVSIPMHLPTGEPSDIIIRPLVIFWFPIKNEKGDSCFFEVESNYEHFKVISIFSISTYLRQLKDDIIEISMPNTIARLNWLNEFFIK